MEPSHQIITIKEARKLLDKDANGLLSDSQVTELIAQLDFIATLAIRDNTTKNPKRKGQSHD